MGEGLPSFRRLNDIELDRLSDEKLIDYIRAARAAKEMAAMNEAIQIFAYRHRGTVLNRMRAKLRDRPDSDIEATTDLVIGGAMFAAFEGESVGEFKALLNRIFARRVADYFRRIHGTIGYRPVAEEVGTRRASPEPRSRPPRRSAPSGGTSACTRASIRSPARTGRWSSPASTSATARRRRPISSTRSTRRS
jgi:hypothetical protein